MRIGTSILVLLVLGSAGGIQAQVTDPIPAPVEKRGLAVEISDLVRLPDTRGLRPLDQDVKPAGWARVSFVRDLPDGRRFANDSRGFLYLLDRNNQPSVYADVAATFPFAIYNRLESGFIGFDFHPEFARNGLFYTVHGERAAGNPATPNFIPPGFTATDVTYHNVITEWHAHDPAANTFDGHAARAAARRARRQNLDASDGRRRVQSDGEAGLARLRPALHERQRSRLQQRRRAEREQPGADAAARLGHHRDPAHRSAQPVGVERHEGARRLHDSAGQQVRRRRRPEDARRDLRLRLPQRASAVVGPDRRHDVRLRHRHEPHRRGQHRPQRRQLRLDEARRLLGERHDRGPAARSTSSTRCRPTCSTAAAEGRVHLSGRDVRPRRRRRRSRGGFAYHGTHRGAARQVRVRRRQSRPPVRGRSRRR